MTTGPTAARAGPWRIGALAALTGATPKALRLYEAEGLLPAPRRQGTYRVYDALHLDTVRLIRTAQALGFSLRELKALAGQARLVDVVPLGLARDAVRRKREALGVQIARLQALEAGLAAFERELDDAHQTACLCPSSTPAAPGEPRT